MEVKLEQWFLAVVTTILTLVTTDVSSIQCYQCFVNPDTSRDNISKQLCVHFDYSDKYVVDCPFSTMCMKKDFYLDIQNGVTIHGVLRGCALQKDEYQEFKNGRWSPKMEILEPYEEGCKDEDNKGERTPSTRYCYCRRDLCNSSPNTSHEGYTDIMGVIVVFNLMKYINSLR